MDSCEHFAQPGFKDVQVAGIVRYQGVGLFVLCRSASGGNGLEGLWVLTAVCVNAGKFQMRQRVLWVGLSRRGIGLFCFLQLGGRKIEIADSDERRNILGVVPNRLLKLFESRLQVAGL